MNDYEMGRENFVNMGEMMMRLNYQQNIGWQEFLGFYTGLNEQRKQYDEKFQEQKGIGEETEDPKGASDDEAEPENVLPQVQQQPPGRFSVAYRAMNAPSQDTRNDLLTRPLLAQSTTSVHNDNGDTNNNINASGLLEEDEEQS